MPIAYCGDAYCYGHALSIESACHDLGLAPNKQIIFQVDRKYCYCLCGVWSGGQDDTPIMVQGWTQIPLSAVVEGQTKVLAAGRNLVFLEHIVSRKTSGTAQSANNFAYVTYLLNGVMCRLVLPATRMMLLEDRQLVAAGKLQLNDKLTDHTRASIPITALATGSYTGALSDIATTTSPPDPNLNGHLLLLNGVVAGDQMAELAPSLLESCGIDSDDDDRPWIGSDAWRRIHGNQRAEISQPIVVDGGLFVPASLHAIKTPDWRSD